MKMIDPQTQQIRNVTQKILDRIAIDPQFRQQMVDDPEGTLNKSEYGQEVRQILLRGGTLTKAVPQLACSESCIVISCWWSCFWSD
jgi:hypothetical protein